LEVFEIGRAVLPGGSSHGNEDHLRAGNGMGVFGSEFEIAPRLRQKLHKPRLVERDSAIIQSRDFARIGVGTSDFVPQKSEANACGQADVTSSKNCNVHKLLSYDGESPREMEP
jgi:hypothetical protein